MLLFYYACFFPFILISFFLYCLAFPSCDLSAPASKPFILSLHLHKRVTGGGRCMWMQGKSNFEYLFLLSPPSGFPSIHFIPFLFLSLPQLASFCFSCFYLPEERKEAEKQVVDKIELGIEQVCVKDNWLTMWVWMCFFSSLFLQ